MVAKNVSYVDTMYGSGARIYSADRRKTMKLMLKSLQIAHIRNNMALDL